MTVTLSRHIVRMLAVAALAVSFAACYPGQAVQPTPDLPKGTLGPVPSAVAERKPLLDCGQETIVSATGYSTTGRNCFIDAYNKKTEAEFRSAFPHLIQNGDLNYNVYITVYYRTFADQHVEIITDGRLASDLGFKWSEQSCKGLSVDNSGTYPSFSGTQPCTDVPLK